MKAKTMTEPEKKPEAKTEPKAEAKKPQPKAVKPKAADKYEPVWMTKDGGIKQALSAETEALLRERGWEETDYDPSDAE